MARPFCKVPKIGTKYGMFTLIGGHKYVKNPKGINLLFVYVECECGNRVYRQLSALKCGSKTACGCKKGGISSMNDLSRTKEYRAWTGLHKRCYDPKYKLYHRYGGRGIKVCKRWHGKQGLLNFIKDMGICPSPELSLERINNDGDYRPKNCKWGTDEEQCNNRSTNLVFNINGKTKTLTQWCREYNAEYDVVRPRIKILKYDIIRALTQPKRKFKKNDRESRTL